MHQVSAEQLALLKVGDLAKRTGKTVRAVHLYEELGLLAPAGRSKGGFSLYHGRAVTPIERIAQVHALGFSLTELKPFLRQCAGTQPPPQPIPSRPSARLARLEPAVPDLTHRRLAPDGGSLLDDDDEP